MTMQLPEYKEEDYPITAKALDLYDTATAWMDEAPFSHRELFRFACQYFEAELQNVALSRKIVKGKAELDELNRQIVILKALKKGPGRG